MTKSNTKLVIELDSQGNAASTLQTKNGAIIADQSDIIRIQTLNASVTKERKDAQKENTSSSLLRVIAAGVRLAAQETPPRVISQVPPSFAEVFRSINAQIKQVGDNVVAIEAIEVDPQSAAERVKNSFLEMSGRIRSAAGLYLRHRLGLGPEQTPLKLNSFLRDELVPVFFYNKLTAGQISTSQQGFDIRSLLFPNDPSKGMFLTFREMRNENILNNLMGLLGNSSLLIEMANDDQFLRTLINVGPTTVLDNFNEERSLASKMASVPFFIVPFEGAVDRDTIFNYLAKNGIRGAAWNAGTVLSPQDNLRFIGTVVKRAYYGLLSRAPYKAGLLGKMFPGFTFTPSEDDNAANIFAALKTWSVENPESNNWFTNISYRTAYQSTGWNIVREVLADVLAVTKDHVAILRLKEIVKAETGLVPVHSGASKGTYAYFNELKAMAATIAATNEDPRQILGNRIQIHGALKAPSEKRPKNRGQKPGTTERSMMTPKAQSAVRLVNSRGMGALSNKMNAWFRQFLSTEIQEQVADLFLARLDAYLSEPLPVTKEERLIFLEPGGYGFEADETSDVPDDDNQEERLPNEDNPDDDIA
jgi:hypothetical protein